jgi:hypothetical protein
VLQVHHPEMERDGEGGKGGGGGEGGYLRGFRR